MTPINRIIPAILAQTKRIPILFSRPPIMMPSLKRGLHTSRPTFRPNSSDFLELHDAVRASRVDIVQTLIGSRGIFVDSTDHLGRTPLYIAAERGDFKMAKLLLENGASPEKSHFKVYENGVNIAAPDSAVLVALEAGHVELAKLIKSFEKSPEKPSKKPLDYGCSSPFAAAITPPRSWGESPPTVPGDDKIKVAEKSAFENAKEHPFRLFRRKMSGHFWSWLLDPPYTPKRSFHTSGSDIGAINKIDKEEQDLKAKEKIKEMDIESLKNYYVKVVEIRQFIRNVSEARNFTPGDSISIPRPNPSYDRIPFNGGIALRQSYGSPHCLWTPLGRIYILGRGRHDDAKKAIEIITKRLGLEIAFPEKQDPSGCHGPIYHITKDLDGNPLPKADITNMRVESWGNYTPLEDCKKMEQLWEAVKPELCAHFSRLQTRIEKEFPIRIKPEDLDRELEKSERAHETFSVY